MNEKFNSDSIRGVGNATVLDKSQRSEKSDDKKIFNTKNNK